MVKLKVVLNKNKDKNENKKVNGQGITLVVATLRKLLRWRVSFRWQVEVLKVQHRWQLSMESQEQGQGQGRGQGQGQCH